ncbi:MAG: rhamnulose-1-phosphate aldolase [Oscillospiraceae bacterium]|nr:rhamnulose-1-phosphate aldolase [Oscillospiraceae bacterium]
MRNFETAPIVRQLADMAANMYRLGWDERNSGNISCLLSQEEAQAYPAAAGGGFPLEVPVPELAGRVLLVTAAGSYFKNIPGDPEANLALVRVAEGGGALELLWGCRDGGRPTSEISAHLLSHRVRLTGGAERQVVLHCHPAHLVAMSHVHPLEDRTFTRSLWQMCTESIMVFPDGVGVLPWMPCGTADIGRATAEKMERFRLVLWPMHGIYAVGAGLDETFGLIETAEKAAQIYMLTAGLPRVNGIRDGQLAQTAQLLGLDYRMDFLDL